ncbi:hypothetical protein [Tsukamurella spumae]|uniref:4Fe-4S Wbl-type domain-containing protein n=1 Tax=Tsukamurella spumae TaxID=44753 RepID=A0A846WXC2_9ACTN|nr:hypothetical protein [Tsukamurella spumae]NKY17524.1 hypothetical protein [Tsukamurella spumae]
MSRLDAAGTFQLLARILDGTPKFDGAACAGRGDLFDPVEPDEHPDDAEYRTTAAAQLCRTCPALVDCAQWIDGLTPARRPAGTIAGRRAPRTRGPGRPKKENTAA